MNKLHLLIVLSAILFQCFTIKGQNDVTEPVYPVFIGYGTFLGETPPLRDIPPMSEEEYRQAVARAEKKLLNPKLQVRSYPYADQALPKGPDEVWQRAMGTTEITRSVIANFAGQTSPYYPSDCNGSAGPNHFVQTINVVYAIYSKTGTLLAGPTNINTIFSGLPGATYNDGDPIVLYDEQAQRWVMMEFSVSGTNDFILMAVSSTSDPTGTWYKYSFDVDDMPDYPKIGVWPDGYYMGVNNGAANKKDIYVFQRSVMLTGGENPLMIGFDNPWRPTTIDGFMCVPPLDNDGPPAPSGAPGIFITINDDAIAGGSDQLWIYELTANWSNPSLSTFQRVQQINVAPFDSNFGTTWNNIVQPGTTQKLDAIPMIIMNAPQYRNFGSYQTIVCCHTVDVNGSDQAGIRWYELRRGTQISGNWTIRQQGTYAPDSHSRWMGSVMLNGQGQIALGYSISSSTVYPGIRVTGQSSAAYQAASGIMDIPEIIIQNATTSQTGTNRWGDYSLMSVDPTDDFTFWYTTQYGGSRQTKIASFRFGSAPIVTTLAATQVTGISASLNATVNPNGLATTCYFEWGTTTNYGNTTPTQDIGSGLTPVNVTTRISGLTPGTTYYFRAVATNSDGTTYGNGLSFVAGGAVVTTAEVTNITPTTATSGGNVLSDGSYPVTARGVCWSTSPNPTLANNYTIDGSGLGQFTSQITGLQPNTTYYVRAYATNAIGTWYGENVTFTTACGTVASFPWNENFENNGNMPACWTQVQINNSGINWAFLTGNGGSYPPNAQSGTYNACLKDNTTADNKTWLITPKLDLTKIINPVLTFWHIQIAWSGRQDQLAVYYRSSLASDWVLLVSYTSQVTSWTLRTLNLPNPSAEYYIAFEGNARGGRGVCIDNITISGTIPTLLVTPSHQNVSYQQGSTQFNVTSNTSWSATSSQTWCSVTPNGSGNGVIVANYSLNTSLNPRTTQITVTAQGVNPVVVTLTQEGFPCPDLLPNAGNDATICQGSSLQLSGSISGNYSGLQWSTTGSGTFSNPAILQPIYYPGANDIGSEITLTLTAFPVEPCTNIASDAMILYVQPLPSVNAGNDITITELQTANLTGSALHTSQVLWITGGDGTFSNPGAISTTYTPGVYDIFNHLATITFVGYPVSPCQINATDELFINILNQQNLQLPAGWSGFSSYVAPLNNHIAQLTSPISSVLIMIKDLANVYWPEFGINTIGNFNPESGYLIKLSSGAVLPVIGYNITNKTISVPNGWTIIPVLSSVPVASSIITDQLSDLVIMTEIAGSGMIWPEQGINTLPFLQPGKAYMLKSNSQAVITFP